MGIIMEIAQDTNMGLTQNTKSEEIKFDADISQLMGLIINSFYSKNEIFLRELLSNSSDALEKIRYESLTNKEVLDTESNLKIKVWVDSDTDGVKNLVIEDTGIGMTKYDLINTLGTIAKSGTKSFIEKIKNKEVDQIGQFGVGFYSSYLVADNVKIYTKHNDDKEDQQEFLEINNIKDIIKKYNQFINFPIEILESKEIEEEVDDEEVLENAKAQTSEKNIENTEVETSEKNIENAEAEIVETSEKNIENAEAEIVEKSEKNIENAEGGEEVNKEDHVNIEDVDEDDDEDDEEKEEQPKKKKVKKTITEWNIINN